MGMWQLIGLACRRRAFGTGLRVAALAAAGAVVVAACSSSGAAPTGAVGAATAVPAATQAAAVQGGDAYGAGGGSYGGGAAATEAPSASAAGESVYVVNVATDAKVGKFLTGEDGKTLYTFKKDSPGTSTCTGQCATNWPPFTLDTGETVQAGSGVTGTLATISRPDGTTQVTYGGMPLYYFAADAKAGDVAGQGIGNVWYVAAP